MTTPRFTLPPSLCICRDPECQVPQGLCHCGCGQRTLIAFQSSSASGYVKGEPRRFREGHCKRIRPILESAKPFKIDGAYCRLLPLTQGKYALIWESDYEWLMSLKWSAVWSKEAGSFYAARSVWESGKWDHIHLARFILGLEAGDPRIGDHINGVTLDYRRSNLRAVDESQSCINRGMRSDNTSGIKGVSFSKTRGLWLSDITLRGKRYCQAFGTREAAAEHRKQMAEILHGEYARKP